MVPAANSLYVTTPEFADDGVDERLEACRPLGAYEPVGEGAERLGTRNQMTSSLGTYLARQHEGPLERGPDLRASWLPRLDSNQ